MTATDKLILSGLLPTEASRYRLRRILLEQSALIDWEELRERGEYLLIFPLLRYNLAQIDALQLVPESLQATLKEAAEVWAARELGVVSESRQLIGLLQAHGIQALPLKGAALMLGNYYPQAGLRPALDIDLIVPPEELNAADQVLELYGYKHLPGRRSLRPRQRLANELNHLWPRRSPGGIVIELHHRAFQYAATDRDFSYTDIWQGARSINASFLPLPTSGDIAFHLIHHTMVDLQSAHAILRTLTDLFFLFSHDPKVIAQATSRGLDFGFQGSVYLAEQAVNHLASANLEALDVDAARPELALLLETALMTSHDQLAEAARIFEYFDFSRRPISKAGNLLALLFPTRDHLRQLYGNPGMTNPESRFDWKYLRRPLDIIRKINWQSLRPANLRRLRRMKKTRLMDRDRSTPE